MNQSRMDNFFGAAQWILVVAICMVAAGIYKVCEGVGKVVSLFRRREPQADAPWSNR